MAIAFRSMSQVTGNGGNATPGEPSGTVQGDVLVALFATDSASSGIGIPAGWTSLYGGTSTTPEFRYSLCYIVRGASAPSYTFTITGGTYHREVFVLAFSGVDNSSPILTSADGDSTHGASNNPNPPAVSATIGKSMALAVGIGSMGSDTGGWYAPSGYSIVTDNTAGLSNVIAVKSFASTGTEDPAPYSNGIATACDVWSATILLRPLTPMAEYSFDNLVAAGGTITTSTSIPDLSGNGNHLVALTDIGAVAGVSGVGVTGDGLSSAQVASTSAIKPTTAVTWMCWAKVTGNTYGWGQIFGRCNDDVSWGDAFSFYMNQDDHTTYRFSTVIQTDTSFQQTSNGLTVLLPSTWVHIAATWSVSDPTLRVFLNGTEVHTVSTSGTTLYYGSGGNTTRHFNLFLNEQYTERGNQIQVDEVRVFNVRLSASEITSWMNAHINGATTSWLIG